jgi:3,4-dihydroxy 2-butanone 4-phosphate synthase/GTP cyclohydrolase II
MNLSIGLGSQLIREAGVRKMKLLSNPVKYNAISGFDLEVVEYISYASDSKKGE